MNHNIENNKYSKKIKHNNIMHPGKIFTNTDTDSNYKEQNNKKYTAHTQTTKIFQHVHSSSSLQLNTSSKSSNILSTKY